MARWEMDRDGVASARSRLAGDPAGLRDQAQEIAAATLVSGLSLGSEAARLEAALARFALVHATALRAVADASASLGGGLDTVLRDAARTEADVASALVSDRRAW